VPTVVLHVSSTPNRESILQYGLDWTRMLDQPGIAGSESGEGACVFLARDIWEVTLVEDLELDDIGEWRDAPPPGPYRQMDGFLCTTQPIPPDRLRLLRKDA
jgi:hypothetical protein